MTRETPQPVSLVRTPEDLLEAAVGRVTRKLTALLDVERIPSEVAVATAEAITNHVRARIADAELGPVPPGLAADPLFRPFLDALTRDLLEKEPDPALLAALRAIEATRLGQGVWESEPDGPASEDLRARLRAPDAFELLLEVAHDFRSPLTSILFLSETLRDGHSGEVTELQRSQLGLIYSAAFGLASVASDVTDLARREHGLVDDRPQPYRPVEVFDTVRRLVSPIVEEKGLELRVDVADNIAHGHPHAVSRVMLNLTTNALKFTDEGYVLIGTRPAPHSRLEFYVHDTGRGIPEERRGELFHPFKRRLGEGQHGHFFSGSGVGLSIAHRLVRAMGSELLVESSDAAGTRFSFRVANTPARGPTA